MLSSIVKPMIGVCRFTPLSDHLMFRAASTYPTEMTLSHGEDWIAIVRRRSQLTPVRTEDENSESKSIKMSEYLKSEHADIACSESFSWVCSTLQTKGLGEFVCVVSMS